MFLGKLHIAKARQNKTKAKRNQTKQQKQNKHNKNHAFV